MAFFMDTYSSSSISTTYDNSTSGGVIWYGGNNGYRQPTQQEQLLWQQEQILWRQEQLMNQRGQFQQVFSPAAAKVAAKQDKPTRSPKKPDALAWQDAEIDSVCRMGREVLA